MKKAFHVFKAIIHGQSSKDLANITEVLKCCMREAGSVWADGMEHHRGSLGPMELRVTGSLRLCESCNTIKAERLKPF